VTELTDGSGATAKAYAYDAWGNVVQQTGTVENPYTYTGREVDAETGLYYYRARYYDAGTGRFVQKDPIGFLGGINLYAYVGDNPVNSIDPYGLRRKGRCTPAQFILLQGAVIIACKIGKRACDASQECSTLRVNLAKNLACAAARDAINNQCFNGGDQGHRTAANEARNAARRCEELIVKKGCVFCDN
jgi:RHS repeat-associated protein